MNKLYLIKKTEISLAANRDNLDITIKYLKNKYPLKKNKLTEIEIVGVKKYREAYLRILELINIEQNINQLDSNFKDCPDSMSKLIFAIIILLLVSIFFLNTIFNFFTIMNISSLWKIVSVIAVGGINFYLAIDKYSDIRLKNKNYNKYKNTRDSLNDEFEAKYEKVLEKIGWFELQSDSLLQEVQNDINNHSKKLDNIIAIDKVFSKELSEESVNGKCFIKTYKKR